MGTRPDDEAAEFAAYVDATARDLRRYAYSLTGDWHLAEDLLQIAYVRVFERWGRIDPVGRAAYTRQVLLRAFLDARRRRWNREHAYETPPDVVPMRDVLGEVEAREPVRAALLRLPPRTRAVVFCRYVEDLDIATTARVLGVTTGTVKSQTARGLAALRELLAPENDLVGER